MSAQFVKTGRPWLSAALLVSLLLSACGEKPAAEASGPPPASVKVQPVKAGVQEESSEFVGTLEAIERVVLQPQIEGRISEIFVENGDRVEQGTPIMALSLDQTQADVASATAAANASRAAFATAQAELEAAEADRAENQADVDLQQVQFDRAQRLTAEGAYSQEQTDITERDLKTAIATLQSSDKDVAAARARLNEAAATVRQAEAEAASVSVNLGFKQVVAPISGVVGDFPVKVGDYVDTSRTLTNITRNEFLDMRISVPTSRSSQLRSGLTVELLDATTGKQIANGSLQFIAAQVSTGEQAILTKARFPNQNGALRDGQFVRARIIWSERPGVLVPTVAVSQVGAQDFVYVAETETQEGESRQVARQRPVKLGATQGQDYQVISGVKAGEALIVSGIQGLTDGAPIQQAASGNSESPAAENKVSENPESPAAENAAPDQRE